jgi:hypothetical protein
LLTEGASRSPSEKGVGLRLREDTKTGIFVEGLSTHPVAAYGDVATLLERGLFRRTVAATNMNLESSRSHSVFVLEVVQHDKNSSKVMRKSKLSLIDLAGSERVERTGATGQRLKEGQVINTSLLTLGRCISALAKEATRTTTKDGAPRKPSPVPFRESTLTLLLRESLSGNARSLIVAAVSPSSRDHLETTSTLRFAATCKALKTKAKVNELDVSQEVEKLKAEVEALKRELGLAKAQGASSQAGDSRLAFLQSKLETLNEACSPQEIRRVWLNTIAEQQRQRATTLFEAAGLPGDDLDTTPYLYNLDQDPQMQGQLGLPLPAGKTICIGRSDAERPQVTRPLLARWCSPCPPAPVSQDLEINGLGIAREHATIGRGPGGTRVLTSLPGGVCYHNGNLVGDGLGVTLEHRDRVVLGACTMVFVVVEPQAVLGAQLVDELCTYSDALEELFAGKVTGNGLKDERGPCQQFYSACELELNCLPLDGPRRAARHRPTSATTPKNWASFNGP